MRQTTLEWRTIVPPSLKLIIFLEITMSTLNYWNISQTFYNSNTPKDHVSLKCAELSVTILCIFIECFNLVLVFNYSQVLVDFEATMLGIYDGCFLLNS